MKTEKEEYVWRVRNLHSMMKRKKEISNKGEWRYIINDSYRPFYIVYFWLKQIIVQFDYCSFNSKSKAITRLLHFTQLYSEILF